MLEQYRIQIETDGRATIEITQQVSQLVARSGLLRGSCQVFVQHTSASLIITENADRNVQIDLENFIARLVPDGDPRYRHDQEGPDDMAAHIRSIITQSEITVPVCEGKLALGTWQGLFLWEHRSRPHFRNLVITLAGDNT